MPRGIYNRRSTRIVTPVAVSRGVTSPAPKAGNGQSPDLAKQYAAMVNSMIRIVDQSKWQGGMTVGPRARFMYLSEAEWIATNIQFIRRAFEGK